MKPENQPSSTGLEGALVETMPTIVAPAERIIDTGIEQGAERYEQRAELSSVASDMATSQPMVTPAVTDVPNNDTTQNLSVNSSVTPAVASDDDLIEKEWVDRAKKIIVDTHDDPYKREQEVSKLQSDYIKKRYGREIGVSE